jgi:hypothetical protein
MSGQTEPADPADPADPAEPTDLAPAADTSSELSCDQMFDLLSNQRRRCVLHFLKQRNGDGTELRELSAHIAAWQHGKEVERITSEERRSVYTSLQQLHLPKMQDEGIITYDRHRGTVELTPTADRLDVYLDVVPTRNVPWSRYYVGLAGLSFVFIAGVWGDFSPLTVLPDLAWAALVVAAFAVSALVHAQQDRQQRLGVEGPPQELREP